MTEIIFHYIRYVINIIILDFPTSEDFGIEKEREDLNKVYVGGEENALKHLEARLEIEKAAFRKGNFLPNRRNPDILCPPKSLSPDLRFGCLSVRKFYWDIQSIYDEIVTGEKEDGEAPHIVIQLLWREFFYTMSVNNPYYGEMDRNPICINIPWYPSENNQQLEAFLKGI